MDDQQPPQRQRKKKRRKNQTGPDYGERLEQGFKMLNASENGDDEYLIRDEGYEDLLNKLDYMGL